MVVEPTAGNLVTENTGPTDLGAGYASIKQGQDEYNKMLAASGVNNSTGNSIDVFNSGTARMYTNQGVQYASVFEFAKILQDYAETNGKEATKEFAFNYGATDSVLAEFRKYTAGAPKFAAGGYHSGGYRVVGEGGPELEATGASRIFNANQTANILGGGMSDQLLTVIAEKLDTMSKNNTLENNVLITHAKKTSSLLDKFDQLGIATRA
jgi:hypothetical protein